MRGRPVTFEGLNGGVNAVDSPFFLKDSEARDARNFVPSLRGKIRKRPGARTFAALPAACDSLFAMQAPSPFLIAARAGRISSISPTRVVATRANPSAGGWEWVQAPAGGGQGPLFGMNGVDSPLQWNGVAAAMSPWTAATGVLPNGKYLVYTANRLFVAGMTAYGSLDDPGSAIVFSNLANPRDWPVENVVEFDPGDGEQITAIGTLGPYVLVFKPNKAWVVYDLDTGANRPLSKSVGCVAHRSVVETPRGTFFLTEDQGVMVTTDGSSVKRVSEVVQPFVDELQAPLRQKAAAIAHADHYYLSISTSGTDNDLTLDFDMQTASWWPHSLAEADWAVWEPAGTPALYAVKAGAAIAHEPFVEGVRQDDGVSFRAYWKGPFHDFGTPVKKRVRAIQLQGRGKGTVKIARAFATTEDELGDEDFLTAGGAIEIGQAEFPTPGVGTSWSLILENESADELELDSYTFAVQARRD